MASGYSHQSSEVKSPLLRWVMGEEKRYVEGKAVGMLRSKGRLYMTGNFAKFL